MSGQDKCFACDKKLGASPRLVDTRDDQTVLVGSECFKLIAAAGARGYQPPKGGPRLWLISEAVVIVTADRPSRYHKEATPEKGYLGRRIRRSHCGLSGAIWNLYFIPRDQAKDRGLSGCKRCYRNERELV